MDNLKPGISQINICHGTSLRRSAMWIAHDRYQFLVRPPFFDQTAVMIKFTLSDFGEHTSIGIIENTSQEINDPLVLLNKMLLHFIDIRWAQAVIIIYPR